MIPYASTRRRFLSQTATGLSGIALAHLLAQDDLRAKETKTPVRPEIDARQPNLPRKPHFAAKAKNVLVIFCSGAEQKRASPKPARGGDYLPEFLK